MTTSTDTPRIYVACLASYNAGRLHGRWIDADQSEDEIQEAIQAILAESPEPDAEEWAIHDHEGFAGWNLSESEDIEEIARYAAMIEEHGNAWAAYVDDVGAHYATLEDFEERYNGEWDSEEAFPQES